MKGAEEIEGGEDEKGQAHALGFIGGVGVWEVGFQAAEPVSDVFFFVQGGMDDGSRHSCRFMLQINEKKDEIKEQLRVFPKGGQTPPLNSVAERSGQSLAPSEPLPTLLVDQGTN